MRLSRPAAGVALVAISSSLVLAPAPAARAQECARAVVVTLPGVTWEQAAARDLPNLEALVDEGAAASMSVRTNTYRTSYASGFATIGAGARVDGGSASGKPQGGGELVDGLFVEDLQVAGIQQIVELAEERGYRAQPGALATALAPRPVVAIGSGDRRVHPDSRREFGRWPLLAAMDERGRVALAASGPSLLLRDDRAPYGVRTNADALTAALTEALEYPCATVIADHGDLARADARAATARRPLERHLTAALRRADEFLGEVRARLDPARDLLLVVSPTSPSYEVPALGVAVAVGPAYPPGTTLESASTRRRGIVTLPDIAPTVLAHHGVEQPAAMNGGVLVAVDAPDDRVAAAIDLNREAVFIDTVRPVVSSWFIVYQVLVYLGALVLLWSRQRRPERPRLRLRRMLEPLALLVVAFPISTYLVGVLDAHALGGVLFALALVGTAVVLAGGAMLVTRSSLDRFLVLVLLTAAVMVIDLAIGGPLQLNTVFGYSPIVAGRFAGIGNISFSILGVTGLLTGAFLVHRRGGDRRSLAVAALVFAAVVVADGAPQLGSDVGGVIALVPALTVTFVLLSGKRPTLRALLLSGLAALLLLAVFLAVDLARPAESRTHLARLFLDIKERGPVILGETLRRKGGANLRVFGSTEWTLLVPVAVAVLGALLVRPRGRWQRLAEAYPRLRAGLVGGLILALLGFAVNDSGIVIPAVILSFLVPMALLLHLSIDAATPAEAAVAGGDPPAVHPGGTDEGRAGEGSKDPGDQAKRTATDGPAGS